MVEELKIGDIVRLRNGEFPMTIDAIEDDKALCTWQDEDGEFKSNWYELTSLLNVEEDLASFG